MQRYLDLPGDTPKTLAQFATRSPYLRDFNDRVSQGLRSGHGGKLSATGFADLDQLSARVRGDWRHPPSRRLALPLRRAMSDLSPQCAA
jgi:hypothetical protein